MVIVHIEDIERCLEDVLKNRRSREEIADWASNLCTHADLKHLKFHPHEIEEQIWNSLEFLQGIDLKDSPVSYLHNLQDIKNHLKRLRDNIN
jgi:hypothetical protein